jgi:hypothetical protein
MEVAKGVRDPFGRVWADGKVWNPLTNDGDALRLAVKLHIKLMPYPLMTEAKHSVIASRRFFAPPDDDENTYVGHEVAEPYGDDPAAATRRAIVKCAAALASATPAAPRSGWRSG